MSRYTELNPLMSACWVPVPSKSAISRLLLLRGMSRLLRKSGSGRDASFTEIVPCSLTAGAFLRRAPQFMSVERANNGPFGVQVTVPLASMLNPAGPNSISMGPVASPSSSAAVRLNVNGAPYVAVVGGFVAVSVAGESAMDALALTLVVRSPSVAVTVTPMMSPFACLPRG